MSVFHSDLLDLKGVAMIRILLLCAMLFQAGAPTATKPLIENERVTVSGLETFPETLCKLFSGENFGKLVLKVADN